LGFLFIDELKEAVDYKNNHVNFAILDMIRALEWVKDNIIYFGGDPNSITIGGHSSGAFMTSWLTTVPKSWSLYHKVLQLEGPLTSLDKAIVYTKEEGNSFGQLFTISVGCNRTDANLVMDCLATTNIQVLVDVGVNAGLLPVVDGYLFPVQPDVAISDPSLGLVNPVPTFMVATANPGTLFVPSFIGPILENGWSGFLMSVYGEDIGTLIDDQYDDTVYGPLNEQTAFIRGATFIGDSIFLCPLRRHATYLKAFTPNVFVAMWNYEGSFISTPANFSYGVIHSAELPFLFGNAVDVYTDELASFTPAEKELSEKFISVVSHFIQHGDPGIEFPAWTPEVNTVINLFNFSVSPVITQIRVPPAGVLPFPVTSRCDLFDIIFKEELVAFNNKTSN